MIILGEEKRIYGFDKFKVKIAPRTPITSQAYQRWGYRGVEPVADDFTLDEIYQIIREGDLEALRQLSRYYYRANSEYRNNIDFLAHLPLYDTMVIPVYQEGHGSKA